MRGGTASVPPYVLRIELQAARLERDITALDPLFRPTRISANGESVNETYMAALRDRFLATVNRVDAAVRAAYRRDKVQGLRISNAGGASGRTYTDAEVAYVRRTGRLPYVLFRSS